MPLRRRARRGDRGRCGKLLRLGLLLDAIVLGAKLGENARVELLRCLGAVEVELHRERKRAAEAAPARRDVRLGTADELNALVRNDAL